MCKPLPKFHYSKIRAVQMCKPKRPRKKLKKNKNKRKTEDKKTAREKKKIRKK